jgi:hypothetical protein
MFDKRAYYHVYNKTEKGQAIQRSNYQRHRERRLAMAAVRRAAIMSDPERHAKQTAYYRKWRAANKDKCDKAHKRLNARLRDEALNAYGRKCKCCGESFAEFLSFDHVNGGGSRQRKTDRAMRSNIHRWLRDHNYPADFQLLCMNCNWAKGKYGRCPHQNTEENVA